MLHINPKAVKLLVCHESASRWGDVEAITAWHKSRGFETIGYHAVILNGKKTSSLDYESNLDGKIELGRPEKFQGAHCAAQSVNTRSLGVCLVGIPGHDGYPTKKQISSLIWWLSVKCIEYNISPLTGITQHSMFERQKPLCASLNLISLRIKVALKIKSMRQQSNK